VCLDAPEGSATDESAAKVVGRSGVRSPRELRGVNRCVRRVECGPWRGGSPRELRPPRGLNRCATGPTPRGELNALKASGTGLHRYLRQTNVIRARGPFTKRCRVGRWEGRRRERQEGIGRREAPRLLEETCSEGSNPKSASGMKQARRAGRGENRQEGANPWRRNVPGAVTPGQPRRHDRPRALKWTKPWEDLA
jgi:hypothetical protein